MASNLLHFQINSIVNQDTHSLPRSYPVLSFTIQNDMWQDKLESNQNSLCYIYVCAHYNKLQMWTPLSLSYLNYGWPTFYRRKKILNPYKSSGSRLERWWLDEGGLHFSCTRWSCSVDESVTEVSSWELRTTRVTPSLNPFPDMAAHRKSYMW